MERLPIASGIRWAVVVAGLWLLWGWEKSKPFSEAPPDPRDFVTDAPGLAALPDGKIFHIEGSVHPRADIVKDEPIAYLSTERTKEHGGGARVKVRRYDRPPLEFRWAGGVRLLERDGYHLRHAPRLPDKPWHHFAQLNSGFMTGEPAILTAVKKHGMIKDVYLSEGPREALEKSLRGDNRVRSGLGWFLKGMVSLILVSIVWPRWKRAGG